jgi:hypothetical protein
VLGFIAKVLKIRSKSSYNQFTDHGIGKGVGGRAGTRWGGRRGRPRQQELQISHIDGGNIGN